MPISLAFFPLTFTNATSLEVLFVVLISIWTILLWSCFQFTRRFYGSVIILGYLFSSRVYKFYKSYTNLMFFYSPNRKAHGRDPSMDTSWEMLVSYCVESTIFMGRLRPTSDRATTTLSITKVPPSLSTIYMLLWK